MLNVAQLPDPAATMTSLVDVAAVVETRLHDAESRVQVLERQLEQGRRRQLEDLAQALRYQDQVRRWIVVIRRSHRTRSHAVTGRTIRDALATLTGQTPVPLPTRRSV